MFELIFLLTFVFFAGVAMAMDVEVDGAGTEVGEKVAFDVSTNF